MNGFVMLIIQPSLNNQILEKYISEVLFRQFTLEPRVISLPNNFYSYGLSIN